MEKDKKAVLDLPHDRVIRDIQEWAQAIPLEEAVTAFLYSVTSADNRYRTVLSSVIWGRSVPMHHVSFATEWDERCGQCSVCGLHLGEGECCEQNLNDYSKFQYHCGEEDIHEAGYVWLDLKEYQRWNMIRRVSES